MQKSGILIVFQSDSANLWKNVFILEITLKFSDYEKKKYQTEDFVYLHFINLTDYKRKCFKIVTVLYGFYMH